jgi:hypothetical protein
MTREIRVSPDGDSVAIRTNAGPEEWNAWIINHAVNGGFWAFPAHVEGWEVLREEGAGE